MSQKETYLIICGKNTDNQLREKPNSKNGFFPIICPPIVSSYIVSSLNSFSMYRGRSVWITKEGKTFALGDNSGKELIGSIKSKLQTDTEIKIYDNKGDPCQIISAVCSSYYTLYLISQKDGSKNLAIVYGGMNDGNPYFLKVKGSPPIALFSGTFISAAIDSEGGVIIIKKSILTSPEIDVAATFLPNKERAASVSFESGISILGESGRLFSLSDKNDEISFSEFTIFSGKKVIDISGKFDHGFAVCDDGSVYCRGSNYYGQIGVGEQVKNAYGFTEIESLKKYKIVAAQAGSDHSLFQTAEGMVLSCGHNDYGQLMLNEISEENFYLPVETTIIKGSTFCIAGYSTSAVFIGDQIPQYTPNKKVDWKKQKNTSSSSSVSSKKNESKSTLNSKSSKDITNFIIGDDNYKTVKKIGEGATSIAYKVIDEETSQIMCKKVIKQVDDQNAFKKLQNSMKEIGVLLSIDHPCICKAFGFNTQEKLESEEDNYRYDEDDSEDNISKTTIALFLEYLPYKLSSFLKSEFNNNTMKIKIAIEVAFGMLHLHNMGLMHRDLKIENIMLNYILEAKIIDFDLVHVADNNEDQEKSLTKGIGTFEYMSPEMLNNEEYDNKTDVYSYGIVLFVLFTGKLPKQKIKEKMNKKQIQFPSPSPLITSDCIELIKKCTSFESRDRPSFIDILNFMESVSFKLANGIDCEVLRNRFNILKNFASEFKLLGSKQKQVSGFKQQKDKRITKPIIKRPI